MRDLAKTKTKTGSAGVANFSTPLVLGFWVLTALRMLILLCMTLLYAVSICVQAFRIK